MTNNVSYASLRTEKNKDVLYIIAISLFVLYVFIVYMFSHTFLNYPMGMFVAIIVPGAFLLLDCLIRYRVKFFPISTIFWFPFLLCFFLNYYIHEIRGLIYPVQFYIGFMFLIIVSREPDNFKTAFKIVKFFSLFYTFGCIFQFLFTDLYWQYIYPFFNNLGKRQVMQLYESNHFFAGFSYQVSHSAGYITSGLGLIFCFWTTRQKRQHKYDILLIILMFLAVSLTGKRGHLLFATISLLLTFYISGNLHKRLNRFISIILGALVLVVIFYLVQPYISATSGLGRLLDLLFNTNNDSNITSGRDVLYVKAWGFFKENQLFGIGWGNFKKMQTINTDVHNQYLQLLCETGLVGLITFLIPVLHSYFKIINIMKVRREIKADDKYLDSVCYFSFYIQTFFILYCFTGNPILNIDFWFMYVFGCVIAETVAPKKISKYAKSLLPNL